MSQPQTKICPDCKAHNIVTAQRCQCGHSFSTQFSNPNQTVLGGIPVQPAPASNPTQQANPLLFPPAVLPQHPGYQPSTINTPSGFIQCYPGAISPNAALWLSFMFPFFAPIYNRQWLKFGLYILVFASAIFTFIKDDSWQMTLVMAVLAIGSILDTYLNSVALSVGFPITQTTFFGTPWRSQPQFVQAMDPTKYPARVAITVAVLVSLLATFIEFAEEREISDARSKAEQEMRQTEPFNNGFPPDGF